MIWVSIIGYTLAIVLLGWIHVQLKKRIEHLINQLAEIEKQWLVFYTEWTAFRNSQRIIESKGKSGWSTES